MLTRRSNKKFSNALKHFSGHHIFKTIGMPYFTRSWRLRGQVGDRLTPPVDPTERETPE